MSAIFIVKPIDLTSNNIDYVIINTAELAEFINKNNYLCLDSEALNLVIENFIHEKTKGK